MNAALFTLATLACGWLALWPLRGRLGAVGYHLAAYPLGLLGWLAVAAVGAVGGSPWNALDAAVGLGAAGILAALCGRLVRGRGGTEERAVRAWTYAVWGGALSFAAWSISAWGITSGAYDSLFHYAAWGVWFADGGGIVDWIAGAYGPLIPAICAGGRLFGIDWMSTPWPLLSAHVLGLVAAGVFRPIAVPLGKRRAGAVAFASCLLLATTAHFAGQVVYLHSHMISASYLVLAVFAVSRAFDGESETLDSAPWLWVGGLAAAGLTFARVDGLAYAAVPLALAGVSRIRAGLPPRVLLPALAGAGVPIAVYYGVAFGVLGGWQSDKLSGRAAAAVLVGLALAAALAAWGETMPVLGRALRGIGAVPSVLVAAGLVIASVALLRWESFSQAVVIMARNLAFEGGFGVLWHVAAAMMVLSFATRRRWASEGWPSGLLLAIVLFFAVALVVHGTGHPGRLGVADSFARVAFHVAPLVFWYGGVFAGGVLAAGPEGRPVPSERLGAT